jgi:hypothetical protein
MPLSRDNAGPAVTFAIATVADEMVFLGTEGSLEIYGLGR